ncbi:RluA family pseudouridine synthase [Aerococcus sp. CDC-944-U94]|nr:RluA family pseudouridine synthase [Aerococcus sp. Group 1]AEA01197.1 pseudouridine synthase, RluA family [Aerococcus sp. Group 1]MCY3054648.1 RluA family pseudouridine synthase [Aerococcus sp. Group 1]MCY3056378.1 RluA family pseudouridine synthase [Aerococcus sp. Group 1]MCY3061980.1 RluA family pseudouridine synthase [Aerococcus sp. Group 1]
MLFFSWTCDQEVYVKTFLRQKGVSRRQLAKIKYHGGTIIVNNKRVGSKYFLSLGDQVTIIYPAEGSQDQIMAVDFPLDILYEDRDYLIVNKPAGYTSIPSQFKDEYSMANFVKAYFVRKNYENQVIHVVTRLDRFTSGAMIFAKHKYAHSQIDQLMQSGGINKQYLAFTHSAIGSDQHGLIEAPIGRKEGSIIERCIRADGQHAKTEYWLEDSQAGLYRYRVQLHTGRTHQIRVHFAYLGAPLCGDDLYGGSQEAGLSGQALHCQRLAFKQPLTQEDLVIEAPLSQDFKTWLASYQKGDA